MSEKIVLETLKQLGLTERDSEVFIFLGKRGPTIARDMQRILPMNKAQLYRSLKNLQSRGMVENTLEYPARFSAISFDQVLDLFIKTKKAETRRMEENKPALLSHWNSLAIERTPTFSDKFMVIEGENYIYSKIGHMIQDAKKQVLLTASSHSIVRAARANLVSSIFKLEVPFQVITNITSDNLSVIEKLIEDLEGFAKNYDSRHLGLDDKIFPRFVIRDEDELIFLISSQKDSVKRDGDTGLWTNNKALVFAFNTFFDQLWKDSIGVDARIRELKTGESPPETTLIKEAKEAYQKYLLMLASAQKEVIVMTTAKGLLRIQGLKKILVRLGKAKVDFKIMVPITSENEESARQLSKYCTIRHVQNSYLRSVIVDGKKLLQIKAPPLDKESLDPEAYFEDCFYTDDPEYVKGRRELLNDLWENAPGAIEQLRRSEARYRSLYENNLDAVMLANPDGTIISANSSAQIMFGMNEEEICQAGRDGLLVNDERCSAAIGERHETGRMHAELSYRRKDGSTFEGEVTSNVFTDADGSVKTSVIVRDITERKKAEEALRRSEVWKATSFYARNLIEASLDPLIMIDAKGKISDVNKATELMTECSRQQLVGRDFSDFFTDPDKAKAIYKMVFEAGLVKDYLLTIRSSSGKTTDVLYNAVIFRNESGDIKGIFAAARDVTELKRIEKTLNRKQMELSVILDSSPTIIFYKNLDGKFIQANKAFARALNLSKEELLDKTVFDLYSAEIAQRMTDDDVEILKSKQPKLGIIEPYESPTGIGWIKTGKIPTFDENGGVNGLIGFSEEITEQKKAQEALIESQRKLQDLIKSIGDFIWEVDSQGKYTYCSPQSQKMWGLEPTKMIGKTPFDFMPPDDREKTLALFTELGKAPRAITRLKTTAIDKCGRLVFVETSFVPFFGNDGSLLGFRGITRDITDKKHSEESTDESTR